MIFGEMHYSKHYDEMHQELLSFIEKRFSDVESGHQGDSYIWIWDDQRTDKVQVDTFTSMHHQIKSSNPKSRLVHQVIEELKTKYQVTVFSQPELEAHED